MARRSTRWVLHVLSGGLLLVTEVSGFYLTLSNFQSVSTLSLPLECVFAYNTPLQGCHVEDFGSAGACSRPCQQGVARTQAGIQRSCAMVSAGDRSLLGEAQGGNLVAVLCGDGQAPAGATSTMAMATTSRAARQGFTRTGPDSTSDASTPTPASASTSASSEAVATGTGGVSVSSALRPQTATTTTTTTTTTQTQPRGGGGSPFDPVPESAAHAAGGGTAWLFAVGSCTVGIYLLL
ncbi:hypothetical protein E4U41_006240 [Claviceps citrina]|nr:hypothetical protein E4U41_006240 [Claviceps citrina]